MGKKKDHYAILGVPKAATAGDINEAYHKQSALKWKEAEQGFERLTTAHKVLGDPLRRPLYDMHLRAEEKLMGKAPPAAASWRGSTGLPLGREVRTGGKGAALGREVAGTGCRKNTDLTGGIAKGAGLGSLTGKAGGRNGKCSQCPGGAGLGGATSTTFFSTGRSTFEMAVKYTNEYYNEENCSSFDGEPFYPTDQSTFKTAVKHTNEYYNEENCSSFDDEPFCPTDHSTFKTAAKYMNGYYYEEKNRSSLDDEQFCPTDHSTFKTAVKYMNGYYDEEENCLSSDCEPFCPTDHSTFKTAVKTMNEYYDEDENLRLPMDADGDDEGGTMDAKDDCGGGADDNYIDHSGAGNDDPGVGDDVFNDDDYAGGFEDDNYYAGGFDDGYNGGDGGDGADDWW